MPKPIFGPKNEFSGQRSPSLWHHTALQKHHRLLFITVTQEQKGRLWLYFLSLDWLVEANSHRAVILFFSGRFWETALTYWKAHTLKICLGLIKKLTCLIAPSAPPSVHAVSPFLFASWRDGQNIYLHHLQPNTLLMFMDRKDIFWWVLMDLYLLLSEMAQIKALFAKAAVLYPENKSSRLTMKEHVKRWLLNICPYNALNKIADSCLECCDY